MKASEYTADQLDDLERQRFFNVETLYGAGFTPEKRRDVFNVTLKIIFALGDQDIPDDAVQSFVSAAVNAVALGGE